jgi:hypothetical protein
MLASAAVWRVAQRRICSLQQHQRLQLQQRRGFVAGNLPFDTYALVVRLEGEGFSRGQAQAITNTLLEVIRGSIKGESKMLATRTEMEKATSSLLEMQKATTTDVNLFKQTSLREWGAAVKDEAARRRHEIDKLNTLVREGTEKLSANARLDMNLERARAKEELRLSEDRVLVEVRRIETLLVDHQQEMLKIKNDVFKSILTIVMGAGGLAVGIVRLAMPGAPPRLPPAPEPRPTALD